MRRDDTFAIMRDPYRFISKKCRQNHTDIFEGKFLFKKTIFMQGQEAAKVFYDSELFIRSGAAPEPIRATLFGKGGIQSLDGQEHYHRKEMFMSFMSQENVKKISRIVRGWMNDYAEKWTQESDIVLYDELQEVLTAASCEWAGIKISRSELKRRTKELTAMFDSAGNGMGHLVSRISRKSAESWIMEIIREIRHSGHEFHSDSPVQTICWFRNMDGKLLDEHTTAVEILNLLRPTVAVSVFMVFLVHALHLHPESRDRLLSREKDYDGWFIQEVRRYYPFFPSVMAKVKKDFHWKDIAFNAGDRVILDLYGTNHDEKIWGDPEAFRPDRFSDWKDNPYDFIPQGGGEHLRHHRCPGEWFTIALMKVALDFFVYRLDYKLPKQNLDLNWSRLPAIPQDRMILSNVKFFKHIKTNSNVDYLLFT